MQKWTHDPKALLISGCVTFAGQHAQRRRRFNQTVFINNTKNTISKILRRSHKGETQTKQYINKNLPGATETQEVQATNKGN